MEVLPKKFWEVVEELKEPALVLKIQMYFGVKPLKLTVNEENSSDNTSTIESSTKKFENKGTLRRLHPSEKPNEINLNNKFEDSIQHAESKGQTFPSADTAYKSMKADKFEDSEDSNFVADGPSSESDSESNEYVVTNKFWYYLFCLGTALGDEIFYASFIPFWFWNIDGAVGRRVVLVWAIIMYIGQGIKDIVRWPRPSSPPVYRLQKKWALEYGMPSTHAMVGASIPLSVILYTMNRYQYSMVVGIVFAIIWCSVVCISRLYLGMHSVLDIVAGLILVLLLMIPLIPLVDSMDHFILTHEYSPVLLTVCTILLVVYSPSGDKWTPTRGDTTVVLGVSLGVQVGAWTNYHLGTMHEPFPKATLPHMILWPSYEMMGLILLRTALGFSCIVATRALCKWASYATLRAILLGTSKSPDEPSFSRAEVAVELGYKFVTYAAVGFITLYLLPAAFRLLHIERPTFYTEI